MALQHPSAPASQTPAHGLLPNVATGLTDQDRKPHRGRPRPQRFRQHPTKLRLGLGDGFTGHSGRVGMAQDLAATGVELPALMTAGRWKNSRMPARYTECQAAGRGAVARYYQDK